MRKLRNVWITRNSNNVWHPWITWNVVNVRIISNFRIALWVVFQKGLISCRALRFLDKLLIRKFPRMDTQNKLSSLISFSFNYLFSYLLCWITNIYILRIAIMLENLTTIMRIALLEILLYSFLFDLNKK